MNQETVMWMIGEALILGTSIIACYVSLVSRVVKLETILSMLGKKAAEILHSPHTPELDALLEKYYKTYTDQHYDLTPFEWNDLKKRLAEIETDMALPKSERILAAMVQALADHKLMRFGANVDNLKIFPK